MVRSLICKHEIECKISGKTIHKGEPYIKIYGYPIKKTEAHKLSDILGNRNEKQEKSECKECKKYDYVKTLRVCEEDNKRNYSLCERCRDTLSEEVIEIKEKLEDNIHHWESFGICIFELDSLKMTQHEDIINNNISEGTIVSIVLENRFFVAKISNIGRLIEDINMSRSEMIKFLKCHRCGEEKRNTKKINKNLNLCGDCRLLIKNRLENYLEENERFVISKTI